MTTDAGKGVDEPAAGPRWLTRGVVGVGTASFFSDSSHEIVTSLLPTFVVGLGGGPGALGVIEGAADALTGVAKLVGGPLAADPRRRGRIASGGYLTTGIATAAVGLATAVWQVATLRAIAWISRGLRAPARDALLISLVPRSAFGRAAGVERAGDNLGAVVGPLIAAALAGLVGVRTTMLLAVIPGVLAALAITVAAREAHTHLSAPGARGRLSLHLRELRASGLLRVLVPIVCFECGNIATTLLILRAQDLLGSGGLDASAALSAAIVMYAGHNAIAGVAALLGGRGVDRGGPWRPLAIAAGVSAAGYATFGWGHGGWLAVALAFALAGAGVGVAETAEHAAIALALPDDLRAQGFGVLGLVQAAGDLLSSAVVGLLWALTGPAVAFSYAAAWMVLCVVLAWRVETAASRPPQPEAGRKVR